jgi:hypothetical protein
MFSYVLPWQFTDNLKALIDYKTVADKGCVPWHKYHFSLPTNQSETQDDLPQKNLHIGWFVQSTMNYDWHLPCVQKCIKPNLGPSPPDLDTEICRHSKYSHCTTYQLPVITCLLYYSTSFSWWLKHTHTHIHGRTVTGSHNICDTVCVSDTLEQRFPNCGPRTTGGPRVLPLWSS